MKRIVGIVALGIVALSLNARAEEATNKQTTCPVMGGSINTNYYADYNGKRVYFCCGMCPAEFKKDPEKYIKKLEDKGVKLEAAPKTEQAKKEE